MIHHLIWNTIKLNNPHNAIIKSAIIGDQKYLLEKVRDDEYTFVYPVVNSVGINQWLGSKNSFYKKRDIFNKIDKPLGSISLCLNKKLISGKLLNYEDVELRD